MRNLSGVPPTSFFPDPDYEDYLNSPELEVPVGVPAFKPNGQPLFRPCGEAATEKCTRCSLPLCDRHKPYASDRRCSTCEEEYLERPRSGIWAYLGALVFILPIAALLALLVGQTTAGLVILGVAIAPLLAYAFRGRRSRRRFLTETKTLGKLRP